MSNSKRVQNALSAGLSMAQVAHRLGYTKRHVRRLAAGQKQTPNALVGTSMEWVLWRSLRNRGHSYRQIAYTYCISHEQVRKVLQTKKEELLLI